MTTVVTLAELQAYVGTDETGTFIESCLTAGSAQVELCRRYYCSPRSNTQAGNAYLFLRAISQAVSA